MESQRKKYILISSLVYLSILIACVITILLLEHRRLDTGCYLADAMLVGVECKGFSGAGILSLILNLPFYLIYLPLLGIAGVFGGNFFTIIYLAIGILLWLPILFLGKTVAFKLLEP